MSWFQLDAESIVARAHVGGPLGEPPRLGTFLWRGVIGFSLLSVAGFVPWAVTGNWLHQRVGEAGLYAVCAAVFIGLSGPLLHRLILGPGSLFRFYKLFSVAFSAYAILWIGGWMSLRGHLGSLVGLLAGTAAMGWILASAFDARMTSLNVIAALFVLNSVGYFGGGWIEGAVSAAHWGEVFGKPITKPVQMTLAKLLWGVSYGIGLGAGIGLAFYLCQANAVDALRKLKGGQVKTSDE